MEFFTKWCSKCDCNVEKLINNMCTDCYKSDNKMDKIYWFVCYFCKKQTCVFNKDTIPECYCREKELNTIE